MTFWAGRYFLAPFLCGFLLVFTFIYLGLVKSDSIFAPIVWLGGVGTHRFGMAPIVATRVVPIGVATRHRPSFLVLVQTWCLHPMPCEGCSQCCEPTWAIVHALTCSGPRRW